MEPLQYESVELPIPFARFAATSAEIAAPACITRERVAYVGPSIDRIRTTLPVNAQSRSTAGKASTRKSPNGTLLFSGLPPKACPGHADVDCSHSSLRAACRSTCAVAMLVKYQEACPRRANERALHRTSTMVECLQSIRCDAPVEDRLRV